MSSAFLNFQNCDGEENPRKTETIAEHRHILVPFDDLLLVPNHMANNPMSIDLIWSDLPDSLTWSPKVYIDPKSATKSHLLIRLFQLNTDLVG